jgi:hypothetical protein
LIGLKKTVFNLCSENIVADFRSLWFYRKFNNIAAVYQVGGVEDYGLVMIYVGTPVRSIIWQFYMKLIDRYEFVTAGFHIEIGQLVKVLTFLRKCD